MKKIRIQRIYDYYVNTAKSLYNEALAIKDAYINDTISYRRARKELERILNNVCWRCRIAKVLAERVDIDSSESQSINRDAVDISVWVLLQ